MYSAHNEPLSPPDFGLVIRRERQCAALLRLMPRMLFICAPGGYGKSVLAAQYAGSGVFDHVYWLRFSDELMSPGDLDRAVASSIASLASAATPALDDLVEGQPTLPEAWSDLSDCEKARVCLVVDGVRLLPNEDYSSSIQYLANARRPVAHVVVTTRDPQPPTGLRHLCTILEAGDLSFDQSEGVALLDSFFDELSREESEELLEAASGQPALLSVLARTRSLGPHDGLREGVPASVTALLTHLAETQLTEGQYLQLAVVAMLGHGTAEDVATVCGCGRDDVDLVSIGTTLPLVRLDARGGARFDAHDLAKECFASADSLARINADVSSRACHLLAERGEAHRALALMMRLGDTPVLAAFLEMSGVDLVEQGRQNIVAAAMNAIGPEFLVGSCHLLMTRAHLHWAANRLGDARQCVSLALGLAEHNRDERSAAEALLLRARLRLPSGDLAGVRSDMEMALQGGKWLAPHDRALAHGYAGVGAGFTHDTRNAFAHFAKAEAYAERSLDPGNCGARVRILKSAVLQLVVGDSAGALATLLPATRSECAVATRAMAIGNSGAVALETGRLRAAESFTRQSIGMYDHIGLDPQMYSAASTLAAIAMTVGRPDSELESYRAITGHLFDLGDYQSAALNAAYSAMMDRAIGALDEALMQVESVMPLVDVDLAPVVWDFVHLERAASLLALGDIAPAIREAQRIHDEVAPIGALYLHLKADLILAEADCRDGDTHSAAARISEHTDYILSESPNWMLAMYIRAFPRLLGVVAKAVGVAELPSHMLSMILPAYAEPAVAAAAVALEPRQLAALSQRLLGRKGSGRRVSDLPRGDVCRVTLFGGMEVITADGPVPAKAWRKRKARLLFAMLAVRRGGDVPTDQILDYLWPEFPEDKALNNMYVVWSAMKHALSPGLDRGEPCPYVERVGTVCHLVRANVTTDLDAFEERLTEGKKADHAGDAVAAIAAYRDVMDLYRGELLPGDAYDDWFRSARDRCKHEYSDAALRLSTLLEARGDVAEALQVLRQALVHDPWREDLYQSVLRHQIAEGQRSAAIETYLSCRSRLTEDLGIDPSAETNKLYQHVLGMESNTDESQWSPAERAIYEREEFFRNRPTW